MKIPDDLLEVLAIPLVLISGMALLFAAGKLMEFINYVQP